MGDGKEGKRCVHDIVIQQGSHAPECSEPNCFNFLNFEVIKTILKNLLLCVFQVKQLLQMWLRNLPKSIVLLLFFVCLSK